MLCLATPGLVLGPAHFGYGASPIARPRLSSGVCSVHAAPRVYTSPTRTELSSFPVDVHRMHPTKFDLFLHFDAQNCGRCFWFDGLLQDLRTLRVPGERPHTVLTTDVMGSARAFMHVEFEDETADRLSVWLDQQLEAGVDFARGV